MRTVIVLACWVVASVLCEETTQKPCEDAFPDCKQRDEDHNLCQHFIDAVAYCPKTCGKCSGPTPAVPECHDFDHLCPALTNSEYCAKDIARNLCPKSCGFCPTTTAEPSTTIYEYIVVTDPNCQDIDPNCIALLQRHYCSEEPLVVRLCRRSCNACPNITVPVTQAPTGPVVEVTTAAPSGVCVDKDVECSAMNDSCDDPLYGELCPLTCGRCPQEQTTEVTPEESTPTSEVDTPTPEVVSETPAVTQEVTTAEPITTTSLPSTTQPQITFTWPPTFIPEYCEDNDKDCPRLERTHNCRVDELFKRLCPVTCNICIPSTPTPVTNVTVGDCRDYIMDCDKLKPSCSFDDLVVRLCRETCNAPPCPPEISSTAAAVTTEAPAVTTEAPVVTTEEEVVTTEAPAVTTEVSGVGNNTPAVETEPPVTTEAPAITTEAPAVTTEAPAVTTEAPAVTTEAPSEVTTAAAETTETPSLVTVEVPGVVTTETPVDTTQAPVDTTQAPVDTTQAPVETTPSGTTEAPATTPAPEGETTTLVPEQPATTLEPTPVITLASPVPGQCFDQEPDCPNLVQTFFCATNELIRRICPESCGICFQGTTPTPMECRDLDPQCPNLSPFCNRPDLLVNRLCRKTCGYCGVDITIPPQIPDPFPLTCRVCVDPFCNQEVESVVRCPEDRPYCATRVVNNADGTRGLTKRCSDQPDCDRGYAGRAAGNETCFNFNPAVITQEAFICFFCCVNNECNRHARPDQITLYFNSSYIPGQ